MGLRIAKDSDIDGIGEAAKKFLNFSASSYTDREKMWELSRLGVMGLNEGWSPRVFVASEHMTVPSFYGSAAISIIAEPGIIVKTGGHNKVYKAPSNHIVVKGERVEKKYLKTPVECLNFDVLQGTKDLYSCVMVLLHNGIGLFGNRGQEAKSVGRRLADQVWNKGDKSEIDATLAELDRLATNRKAFLERNDLGEKTDIGAPALKIARIIREATHRQLEQRQHETDGLKRHYEFMVLAQEMFRKQTGYSPKKVMAPNGGPVHWEQSYNLKQALNRSRRGL